MKFAHLADSHIGVWRDPLLKELSFEAFEKAIESVIKNKVDFMLFAGDLFNSALPPVDFLKRAIKSFKKLKENNIPVYLIAGSHDFSPSGKSMLDVLEEADLIINVVKGKIKNEKLALEFTEDKKTGAKITGMLGKAGMLDKEYYKILDYEKIEKERGFKIFMFHTAISELKPKYLENMDSEPLSILPKNFNYYAGGHVHIVDRYDFEDHKNVAYPGPIFPCNFAELEKLKHGGYYLYNEGKIEFINIDIKQVVSINFDANGLTPQAVTEKIIESLKKEKLKNSILLIRIKGTLLSGKSTDINFKEIYDYANSKGVFIILRNLSKLDFKKAENIKIKFDSSDSIEHSLLKENVEKASLSFNENLVSLSKDLIQSFSLERGEAEKKHEYDDKIVEIAKKHFNI